MSQETLEKFRDHLQKRFNYSVEVDSDGVAACRPKEAGGYVIGIGPMGPGYLFFANFQVSKGVVPENAIFTHFLAAANKNSIITKFETSEEGGDGMFVSSWFPDFYEENNFQWFFQSFLKDVKGPPDYDPEKWNFLFEDGPPPTVKP